MEKILFNISGFLFSIILLTTACTPPTNWDLANKNKNLLRVSTIFTAHDVRDKLSYKDGLDSAILWCKNAGVTRVFIETFRGYTAERETLLHAKEQFEQAGIETSGCVTTVNFGKPSTGGSIVSCYTSEETRKELIRIFEYTASMFDLIMIDDFLFTHCECEECIEACGEKSMSQYRCDLMNMISTEYILKPARAKNPNVKIINKYPLWYDDFHRRGYEVIGETESYDFIWVGTETRDNDFINNTKGLNDPQYGAYFIMRWLTDIGGDKTGGGWFDALGTTPKTYLEQARQTVLADAKEMMLFSYGGLNRETNEYGNRKGTGIADIEALKVELPGLFELAKLVDNKPIKGILAVKPANSEPHSNYDTTKTFSGRDADAYIYNFVGMLGLPLVPMEKIDMNAEAAFFPVQILKDPDFHNKLNRFLADNKPVLITDGLANHIKNVDQYDNLHVLNVNENPRNILQFSREELNSIRNKMLVPFGVRFDAPSMVSLFLMGDDLIVIENFKDEAVSVTLETEFSMAADLKLVLPATEEVNKEFTEHGLAFTEIPPRTLVAIQY
ncbi:MAG: hypothetical protein KAI99_23195 [Cyclobacteriaceae bacterium]|nr:hypothetical protein [Cyclobacteriaceae bacterium]